MKRIHPPRPGTSGLDTRAALLGVWGIGFLGTLFTLVGPSWRLGVYRLVEDGGCALAWVAGATGIGWVAWRIVRPSGEDRAGGVLAGASSAALGLGILSLLTLGLGLAGWLNQYWAIGLIGGGGIISIILAWARGRTFDLQAWLVKPASWNWLWALAAPVAGVVVAGAFFPPGLLWGDEPNGYDVVEYHLQVPREWYEAGKIVPLHYNVFSYFPFNVEMHYLLAMHLRGGPWTGMYLAQLMHAGMCGLAVAAVYGLAGGGRRGILAGMLTAVTPWTPLLAAVAYDDGGTLLFGILAIGWAVRARSGRGFVLAGIMAGLAAGTKLSIVPLLFVGVPLALFVARPRGTKGLAIKCSAYLAAAVVVVSPWLIRNWAWAGNPVFPEAMTLLGNAHFSDAQVERWHQAYLPDAAHRSVAGHLSALEQQVWGDWRYGFVLLPMGCVAIALARKNRMAIYLSLLVFFQIIFWLLFTHLQSRFMVIVIPIVALLIAQYESKIWLAFCVAAIVGMTCLSCYKLIDKLSFYIEKDRELAAVNGVGFIGRENLEGFTRVDLGRLPEGADLNLVGDARAFLYQIPMSRLHYKTVFDVDTGDGHKSIIRSWLAGMPAKGLISVESSELRRFARTYYGVPPPPSNPRSW